MRCHIHNIFLLDLITMGKKHLYKHYNMQWHEINEQRSNSDATQPIGSSMLLYCLQDILHWISGVTRVTFVLCDISCCCCQRNVKILGGVMSCHLLCHVSFIIIALVIKSFSLVMVVGVLYSIQNQHNIAQDS